MKVVWTVLIVVLIAALICWVREGADFNIVTALPLLGGRPPGCGDVGALALLAITGWGVARLWNRKEK